MVRFPHEPTDAQIERWYNKMSPKQRAQLDKEVSDFHRQVEQEKEAKKNKYPPFTVIKSKEE